MLQITTMNAVRENDGRKIDHKSLEILRLRAVDQMLAGTRPQDVASALGLARATVYGWLASYRAGGRQALLARSAPGRPPNLSPAQISQLWRLIVNTDPRQHQFDSALWTRSLVGELIRREVGVGLSVVTVGRLLIRMGLSPGPQPRMTEYPAIRASAEAVSAVIYFAAETPTHPNPGSPPSTMISAVSARAARRFAVRDHPPSGASAAEFCLRLLHDVRGPVYLIADGSGSFGETDTGTLGAVADDRLRLFLQPGVARSLVLIATDPAGLLEAPAAR